MMRPLATRRIAQTDDRTSGPSSDGQEGWEVFDAAPAMMYLSGADGRIAFVNQRVCEFIGGGAELVLGGRWIGPLHPEHEGPSLEVRVAAQQARREYKLGYCARRCDGEYRALIDSGRPRFSPDGTFAGYVGIVVDISDHKQSQDALSEGESRFRRMADAAPSFQADGRFEGYVGSCLDITERKRAEAALRESEALVRSVFASLYGHVAVIDQAGNIAAVNDAWLQFARKNGVRSEAIGVGVNYLDVCRRAAARGDQSAASVLKGMQSVLSGETPTYSLAYRCPSSEEELWFEMNVLPLKRREGGAFVFHLDVTARHRAEVEAQRLRNELSHVTRVSIMGELTASLAHELNQPLTAILSNTQAALRLLGQSSEVPGELREILEDIALDDQRAGDIIRRLRQLMKKDEFLLQPVDLNELVLEVGSLLESDALIREIPIESHLSPDLPPVRGDRIQLQQVLLNLMLNGLEAMRTVPNDGSRKLVVVTSPTAAQSVLVAIKDAGVGVSPEQAKLIFEPFFTTKSEGMGMGLSICRSILTTHGGRISVSNNADRGATFEFELPVMEQNQP